MIFVTLPHLFPLGRGAINISVTVCKCRQYFNIYLSDIFSLLFISSLSFSFHPFMRCNFRLDLKWLSLFNSLFSAAPVEAMYPDDPAVYHYTYSVDDDYTGAQIYADEARDEQKTHGMYEVRN